ncbi:MULTISPECIES: HesA/MoeB/ThiF family protein [unclassified Microbacterium]|nr:MULTISPECIES: HesA/MoeB/ThiF family protein [unclassified Microbacterium]
MQPLVAPAPVLEPEELVRTARHAVLAGIGEEGQRRLNAAHVTIVGAGGLGSPVLLALAAAGVGSLTVIDDDVVELTNLQRQLAHRVEDIGTRKTASAARAITALAPHTVVTPVPERLDASNAERLLTGAHVVVDTSDTFATRREVAAACEALGLPLVWGAVQEWHAQATVFWSDPPAGEPVVLADLFPVGTEGEPPSCAQVGVLGALCVQVGGMLAGEVIKLVTGAGEPLLGRLAMVDALTSRQHEIVIRPATATTPEATAGARA